jgi:hypothetical protein
MCNYFSCIIDRKLNVHWLLNSNAHEEIIRHAGFKDERLEDRDFVRIEITPKNTEKITRNKKDWNLKVDEPGTLPDWYLKKIKKAHTQLWKAWGESVKRQLALNEEEHRIKEQYMLALGNSTVEAWDNSTVKALGNSTVKALGNSTVEAWDNSTVKAWDNSTVKAWGNSTVKALGNSTVKALGNSTVKALGNSTVKALGQLHSRGMGQLHSQGIGQLLCSSR